MYACVEERRLGEQLWRSEGEGKEARPGGENTWAYGVSVNEYDRQRRGCPARGRCRNRNANVNRTTGLRKGAMCLFVVPAAVMITRLRVRAGHRQAEHQRQHNPQG